MPRSRRGPPRRPRPATARFRFPVVVVGGGLAGLCAAVNCARAGVRTALIHDRPMLGGNSSSEVRLVPEFQCWRTPWAKETGLIEELYAEDRRRNHQPWLEGQVNVMWDLTLYDAAAREPNLALFLNCPVRDVTTRGDSISSVVATEWGSGREITLTGDLFVDTTGTGTLGYLAGADHAYGREGRAAYGEPLQPPRPDKVTMGNTQYFQARETGREIDFVPPSWAAVYPTDAALGPYRQTFSVHNGYFWLEVGQPFHPIEEIEAARLEGVRHVLGVWDHLKNSSDHGAGRMALDWISWVPYQRESRRLLGDHVLTQQDIQNGTEFDDVVSFGVWPIDLHHPGGILAAPSPLDFFDDELVRIFIEGLRPFSIPWRCLYSRNIRNLMMAGRPMSCSYVAFSSTRILPTGALAGQAVGAGAALCASEQVLPRDLLEPARMRRLQQSLLAEDQYLPGRRNEDRRDLALRATVTASTSAPLSLPAPVEWGRVGAFGLGSFFPATDGLHRAAQLFPVSSSPIESVSLELAKHGRGNAEVLFRLHKAADVWDFDHTEVLVEQVASLRPGGPRWVTFDLGLDVQPRGLYIAELQARDDVSWGLYQAEIEGPDMWMAIAPAVRNGWTQTVDSLRVAPTSIPPGTTAAYGVERMLRGASFGGPSWIHGFGRTTRCSSAAFALRIEPVQHPYGPENVTSGVTRPERWTNVWMSNPAEPLPQWLRLDFNRPRRVHEIRLTFDTDLSRMPEYPLYVSPECVRDYELKARVDGRWRRVALVENNYLRHRVHRFPATVADAIRLTITATNGAPSAKVYEVRVY